MRTDGFSLIEVVVALSVLSVVILGFAATTANLARSADEGGDRLVAIELLQGRLREIAMDPDYDNLESKYEDDEKTIPGFPGYQRSTSISHVTDTLNSGRILDYHRIMVQVDGPGLRAPISRTITIAAP